MKKMCALMMTILMLISTMCTFASASDNRVTPIIQEESDLAVPLDLSDEQLALLSSESEPISITDTKKVDFETLEVTTHDEQQNSTNRAGQHLINENLLYTHGLHLKLTGIFAFAK